MRLPLRREPRVGVPPADGTVAWDAWTAGWGGALAIAFGNAALRRAYAAALPELTADQLAGVLLLVQILPWTVHVERPQPAGPHVVRRAQVRPADPVDPVPEAELERHRGPGRRPLVERTIVPAPGPGGEAAPRGWELIVPASARAPGSTG